jgi:hypothetical protein
MTWVELQEKIKHIFEGAKVKTFDDVLETDRNGYNWILTFNTLTIPTALIIHTKFIFKLDHDKQNLRANEFLYLYDLNCKYRFKRFKDLDDLEVIIRDILYNNRLHDERQERDYDGFGENVMAISKFMTSPAKSINQYFYENEINNLSVYDFEYEPTNEIIPCKLLTLDFEFNINNRADVKLNIRKEDEDNFVFTFTHGDKVDEIDVEDLVDLTPIVAQYIKRNFA